MIQIAGITIHLYGLIIAVSIGVGYWLANRVKKVSDFLFGLLVTSGIIGARLYHVADYWDRYYSMQPIKILYLWEGGLGIWGAIIGVTIALAAYCLINRIDIFEYTDAISLAAPLMQSIGRWGNFANNELWGKNGEPLFFYESALNLILFGLMWRLYTKNSPKMLLTRVYLAGYGVIRLLLEGVRPDNSIWRIAGWPVASLIAVGAITVSFLLGYRRRQL